MLAIRMQRTGRSGHAMFRMVVQDAHRSPTSGKIVAYIGSYDPHTKKVSLDKDKASFYLEHGAQPSPRLISILKAEKVSVPKWAAEPKTKKGTIRNPEKRRSTAPAGKEEPKPEQVVEAAEPAKEDTAEQAAEDEATEKEVKEPETKIEAKAEEPGEVNKTEDSPPEAEA